MPFLYIYIYIFKIAVGDHCFLCFKGQKVREITDRLQCVWGCQQFIIEQVSSAWHEISSFFGAGDVWFSLSGTTYQNNSIVTLENIGVGDDALLCITNQTACCQRSYIGSNMSVLGNWYFPNGTRVPSRTTNSGEKRDFYRTRGHMVVRMQRRRSGEEGIYRCVIPDSMNVTQTIYIGVYSASTGK